MSIIYVDRYGVVNDIKQHIYDNRKKYVFAVVVLCVAFGLGMSTATRINNPYNGLYQYNQAYFNMMTIVGKNSYLMSQILLNLMSLVVIYIACLHYYSSSLCSVVLMYRAYNMGLTIVLLFRLQNAGAILVVFLGLIPSFVVLYGFMASFCVLMYNTAHNAFRYGESTWTIYQTKNIWGKLILYATLDIVLSSIGAWLTMLLGNASL
ncbi:MAG: hypothetical protein LBK70_02665 [Clostridiales bacterium]|jgi:hypothetical protein|nr:hypothetical protein [Clostridiales bacterium]